ncbi:hypothetical protein FRB96_004869 [Tulasnella sp. 330]|nr:hypothetical protein FRB96_004869 [Tulasnella sp. 330]KAG8885440.1 hypothetical protein FRB97_001163 [Tulasnella sp. 331]KAG8890072.1 hypothetical protein FRB98_001185 [Tulasnella sp. 332]
MEHTPPEVLLLIVEIGDFWVDEGLAVRATSRKLAATASERSFWLAIASKTSFLPIPSLSSLAAMNSTEIMRVCIRYKHTRDNLRSTHPEIRRQRVLTISDDEFQENLCGWNFLPGGRYIITYLESGQASVWDTEIVQLEQKEELEEGIESKAMSVGRLLATYEIGFGIWQTQTYHTSGVNDSEVRCVATSERIDNATKVCIFRFVFKDPDHVNVEQFMRSRLPILEPTVASSQHLSVFCGEWQGFLRCVVVDWKQQDRGCVIDIDSRLIYTFGAFDPHLTQDGDLLLISQGDTHFTIHAYFDVSSHLVELDSASWNDRRDTFLAPSASRYIPYGESSRITSCSNFITFTAFNTPNSRSNPDLVVIGLGLGPDLVASNGTFGIQRLDPTIVVRHLKDEWEPSASTMLSSRAVQHCSQPVGLVSGTSELLVVGTCGRYLMWVTASDTQRRTQAEHRAELMILVESEKAVTTESMSASLRNLKVPIDLKNVEQMDICDEMGVFGFAMNVGGIWSINLFDY